MHIYGHTQDSWEGLDSSCLQRSWVEQGFHRGWVLKSLFTHLLGHALILPGNPGHSCSDTSDPKSHPVGCLGDIFPLFLPPCSTSSPRSPPLMPSCLRLISKRGSGGSSASFATLFVVAGCLGNGDCGQDQAEFMCSLDSVLPFWLHLDDLRAQLVGGPRGFTQKGSGRAV